MGKKRDLLREFYQIRVTFEKSSKEKVFANVRVNPDSLSPEKPVPIPEEYQKIAEELFFGGATYARLRREKSITYLKRDHTFASTREAQFLERIVQAGVNITEIDGIEYIHKKIKH